ncbi:MAG TPA: SDR family NAD(P)-dependent oxidoreductase [Acidimicrobiia bacterium]
MTDLVVVTGASSGLGLALARSVPFPSHVVDVSRSGPPEGSGIDHFPADLSQPGEWAGVGDEIKRLVGEHDPYRVVMIHAAGTLAPIGFAGEVDSVAYTSNVLLNSAAGQVLGHHFLNAVAGRDGNRDLVMVSSGAARSVYAGWSSYGAGKAALDQWVRNVGAEQKERGGVRVSAIAPGVIATAMQEQIRMTPKHDFPEVERFHDLYQDRDLVEPAAVARRIWDAIEHGIETGSVLDVRRLG